MRDSTQAVLDFRRTLWTIDLALETMRNLSWLRMSKNKSNRVKIQMARSLLRRLPARPANVSERYAIRYIVGFIGGLRPVTGEVSNG